MSEIELYHGSTQIVEKPLFGAGNPKNDYGLAFYCTKERELACEWACGDGRDGFVNRYRMDMSGLRVLDLNSRKYNTLHWLAVLVSNRVPRLSGDIAPLTAEYLRQNFSIPLEQYDVVKGYRADDSYFAFASAFLSGSISLPKLQRAMRLGKLGVQVAPRTQRAYDQMEFLDAYLVLAAEYYPRRQARDQKARSDYRQIASEEAVLSEPRITDILREKWQADDPRLWP